MIEEENDLGSWRRVVVVEDLGDRADPEGVRGRPPLLDELAGEGGDRGLAELDLAAGELEHLRAVGGLGPPSLEEEAARGEPDEAGGDEEAARRHARGIAARGNSRARSRVSAPSLREW